MLYDTRSILGRGTQLTKPSTHVLHTTQIRTALELHSRAAARVGITCRSSGPNTGSNSGGGRTHTQKIIMAFTILFLSRVDKSILISRSEPYRPFIDYRRSLHFSTLVKSNFDALVTALGKIRLLANKKLCEINKKHGLPENLKYSSVP